MICEGCKKEKGLDKLFEKTGYCMDCRSDAFGFDSVITKRKRFGNHTEMKDRKVMNTLGYNVTEAPLLKGAE
jgi:hypothetical protein